LGKKYSAVKLGGYMSSESFLARWNIYLNSHNEDVTPDANNADTPVESQAEEASVDSPVVEVAQLNDRQADRNNPASLQSL
jgi:hypothetical protein